MKDITHLKNPRPWLPPVWSTPAGVSKPRPTDQIHQSGPRQPRLVIIQKYLTSSMLIIIQLKTEKLKLFWLLEHTEKIIMGTNIYLVHNSLISEANFVTNNVWTDKRVTTLQNSSLTMSL